MSTKIASFRVNVWDSMFGIECLSFDWDRFPKLRHALRSLDFGIAIEWQPTGFHGISTGFSPHVQTQIVALSFTKIAVADLGNHAEYEIFTHQLSTLPQIK